MTNRIFAAAVLMVSAASAGSAAGVDGKWTAEVPGRQGTMEMVFDLKADGDKVTGTIYNDFMGESEIQDGKIEGDEVSFKQVMEMGRTLTFTYTGTSAVHFPSGPAASRKKELECASPSLIVTQG